jgi:thiopeptide-type bacteriocin biosynthesis protein
MTLLQGQGVRTSLGFDWGPLDRLPFLPRVAVGRFVLARATWNLTAEELKTVTKADGVERYRAMQRLRCDRGLPRWIALVEADNVLPVDLDNVLAVDTLAQLVKSRPFVRIEELLPGPEDRTVAGPDGFYRHELVVLMTRAAAPKTQEAARLVSADAPPRVFYPGSEWLYTKVYTGISRTDRVLTEAIAPVVAEATASGAIDRWFFLRYGDPDHHVRVRFHGPRERLLGEVVPALEERVARLTEARLISRFEIATYVRELERYAGPAIDLAEHLFWVDSAAVLRMIQGLSEAEPRLRWQLALLGVHQLFDDFGLGLDERARFLDSAVAGGLAMQGYTAASEPMFDAKFRKERAEVERLLWRPIPADDPLAFGVERLRERSQALGPIVAELRDREPRGALGAPVNGLLGSYAHMHVNRLLPARAVLQELVIYSLLKRAHESRLARERKARAAAQS